MLAAPFWTRLEAADLADDTWVELTSALGDSVQTGAALAAGLLPVELNNQFDAAIQVAYDTAAKTANVSHPLAASTGRTVLGIVGDDGGPPVIWVKKPAGAAGQLTVGWKAAS